MGHDIIIIRFKGTTLAISKEVVLKVNFEKFFKVYHTIILYRLGCHIVHMIILEIELQKN